MISDFNTWEVNVSEKGKLESAILEYTTQSMPSTSQIWVFFNLQYFKTVLMSSLDYLGVGRFQWKGQWKHAIF